MHDVVADSLDQLSKRGERTATDRLPGDDAEPRLDLIDPGRTFRCEMESDIRVLGKPRVDVLVIMRGQIVHNHMDILILRVGPKDVIQEHHEFRGPSPIEAATDDGAGQDIQGGEQVRGPVTDVVMRTLLGLPEGDRQQRLRPVQGLDLRFLIKRQHHRTRRGVQIQTHDVRDLRPGSPGHATP